MLNSEQLTGKDASAMIALPEHLSNRKGLKAHPEAISALVELQQLAQNDHCAFTVVSSYRSFDDQKKIWNKKFHGETPLLDSNENQLRPQSMQPLELVQTIMLYSALPGASRHHWGTDFDIFPKQALQNGYQPQLVDSEFSGSGVAAKLSDWLKENLIHSNFFRPYEKFQQGIAAEPWHISYFPLADSAMSALSIRCIEKAIDPENDLAGKQTINENLEALYQRYIINVCHRGKAL